MKVHKDLFLFGLSGRLGDAIFVTTASGTHVRSVPKRTKPHTEEQKFVNKRFTFASRFASKGRTIFIPGFSYAGSGNWYPLALKYSMEAVESHSSCYTIDYSRLKVSEGSLKVPRNVKVEKGEKGICFKWDCKRNHPLKAKMAVMAVAYLPLHDTWLSSRAFLGDRSQLLSVPKTYAEGFAETYLFVMNEEEKNVSTSIYLGSVEI